MTKHSSKPTAVLAGRSTMMGSTCRTYPSRGMLTTLMTCEASQ
jgi:hypothetical protein